MERILLIAVYLTGCIAFYFLLKKVFISEEKRWWQHDKDLTIVFSPMSWVGVLIILLVLGVSYVVRLIKK
jgi:hypothetical protein